MVARAHPEELGLRKEIVALIRGIILRFLAETGVKAEPAETS